MFFYLLAGHALADFPLQGESMAACKCPKSQHPAAKAVPWYYWLSAHALVHGGVVAAIIRFHGYDPAVAVGFGIAETLIHWVIDYGKCAKWFCIHTDQILHVACKAAWTLMLMAWW